MAFKKPSIHDITAGLTKTKTQTKTPASHPCNDIIFSKFLPFNPFFGEHAIDD